MALPSDVITGTITLENGSADFTGTGTPWLAADFQEGDIILDIAGGDGRTAVISSITTNTAGVLTKPWEGPDLTSVAYRMRFQWDSSRVSGQTRNVVELLGNGNLQSLAAVTGPGVVVMNGPHSIVVKPETDFINGVAYDVQVDTLADRAPYDGQSAGFSVLVSDVGDGRSAVYSKASNSSGDWSDPAYVTGPVGPLPTLDAGTTTTLPPGSDATVDVNPVMGGYEIDFGIPEGRGARYIPGGYNPATAYVMDDAVTDNGSSWILTAATSTGNAPPVLPTTSNAFWSLLARRGTDGAGTGDVVGPASATANAFAMFADTTGKLLKTLSYTAVTALLNAFSGDSGSGGLKGLVPAPGAGDAAANKFLKASGTWETIDISALMLNTSINALQAADNANLPVYGPNWVADPFDTLTLVDVGGSTNLNTGTIGVLKPTSTWGSTSFVTHMDGTNGSTSFSDETGVVALAATGVTVNTANAKFGTGGAAFPSTGYILADGNAAFTFGTGDFTVDFWIKPLVTTGMYLYDGRVISSEIVPLIRTNGSAILEYFVNGSVRITGTTPVSTGTYHHVALTRVSGTTRLFLDGVVQGTPWTDASSYIGNTARPAIGTVGDSLGNSAGFNGYMDELRVCKGTGLWSANFTPPTAPAAATPNNLTVRSAALAALTAPVTIEALIPIREVDAATPVTDYTVEFSRDGGTTWTSATLTELFASPSPIAGIIFVRAVATVSGQPSGTSVRWRFKTLTGKMIEFHGIKTEWN